MKKILIIGSAGAGKSTLAKEMHEILGIEIIHLDQHYWQPNWTRTDEEAWQKKVEKLLEEKKGMDHGWELSKYHALENSSSGHHDLAGFFSDSLPLSNH